MHQRPTTSFWMTWDLRGHLFREALWLKQLDCRNPRGNDRFRGASCDCCHGSCSMLQGFCNMFGIANFQSRMSLKQLWENLGESPISLSPDVWCLKIHQKSINILSESAQIGRFFHDFSRSWKKGFWPSCDSWRPRPGSDATFLGHSNDLIPEILTLQLYLHMFTYIYI